MKEKNLLRSAPSFYSITLRLISFIFRRAVMDQRQAPKCISAWHSLLTAGIHLPAGKRWLLPHYSTDGHNERMTFVSILMDIPDNEK